MSKTLPREVRHYFWRFKQWLFRKLGVEDKVEWKEQFIEYEEISYYPVPADPKAVMKEVKK